ncbi:unnamed protein product [Parnassius mnemosyne]|uniref:Fatty acyl-CoA reductase n=1 Tax=Parnassius mnemosyne TaxID=213953 RepID=A0AAV1LYX1_9NEOP
MDEACNNTPYLSVPDFYSGKSVFVTGGTGFLGKVLIEKLLYSCDKINNIYVLLRNKNGVRTEGRLKEMLKCPVFTRLREQKPESLQKIKPIQGDITSNNLGMTNDQQALLEKVSVVFHLAATIKFSEPLKTAVNVNLEGTREVLRVFKRFNHLEAFVYVSTTFSNADKEVIEEIKYPPPRTLKEVYDYIEQSNECNKDENIDEFLNGLPNTYTFTKALAESLVVEEHGDIPSVIVRPSIVTPAAKEPMRGWIDNWLGITTFILSVAKGWIRVLYGNRYFVLDLIPVDYVVNLIIITGARCKRSGEVPVYNICSSSSNPISSDLLGNLCMKESAATKFNDFPLIGLIYTTSARLVKLFSLLFETIPAYIADFWIYITRTQKNKFSYVKAQSKQSMMREAMHYFQSRSWLMKSARTSELFAAQSDHDRQLFPCEPTDIKWTEYIPTYIYGMKKFLLDTRTENMK